jgi:hypothetical protein
MEQIDFCKEYLENEQQIVSLMAQLQPLLDKREKMEKAWPSIVHIRGPSIHHSNFKLVRSRSGEWVKRDETLVEEPLQPKQKKRKQSSPDLQREEARKKLNELSSRTETRGGPPPVGPEKKMDESQNF